ncbi:hypothetical protein [Acinetobacter baumannii]|uniref:hypothetical protein n=1 Tax=Acinetobacter baumannii TaxID=470 RepID=UPI00208E7EAD|nr:hypothetical protein [Acinetobacter baumannii]
MLTDELLLDLCSIWANKFYPDFRKLYTVDLSEDSYSVGETTSFEEFFESEISEQEILNDLEPKLTIDLVADLYSLFYFSRDNMKYSEYYLSGFDYYKNDLKSEESLMDAFDHIFSKSNFLENIVKSLFFLNQLELAEKIVEKNNLDLYFKFLPDVRSRVIFKKSELLGYKS